MANFWEMSCILKQLLGFCALESAALKKMSLNRKYSLQDCTGTKCWKGWIASWPLPTSFSEHDASTFPACNKHKESLCAKNPSSNFMLDFWEQVCDHLQGISEFIQLTNNDLSFPGIYFGQRWAKYNQIPTFPEIPNSIQNQSLKVPAKNSYHNIAKTRPQYFPHSCFQVCWSKAPRVPLFPVFWQDPEECDLEAEINGQNLNIRRLAVSCFCFFCCWWHCYGEGS